MLGWLARWIAELIASLRPRAIILVARAVSPHLIQGAYVVTTAVLEITPAVQSFPHGTVAGPWRFSVEGVGANTYAKSVDQDALVATFAGLAAGDYVASAVRLDAAGVALHDAVVTAFVVADDTPVTIDVANGLAVKLQAD